MRPVRGAPEMIENCIFCKPDRPLIAENEHAIAFYDAFPISKGHTLIVPRQHVETIFEVGSEAYAACFNLLRQSSRVLDTEFSPDGFNIGVNCGKAAGQSVWHAHIHLIPRYIGDVEDPLGGVRNVIPRLADYKR